MPTIITRRDALKVGRPEHGAPARTEVVLLSGEALAVDVPVGLLAEELRRPPATLLVVHSRNDSGRWRKVYLRAGAISHLLDIDEGSEG